MTAKALCIVPHCGGENGLREAVARRLTCAGCLNRLRRDLGAMGSIAQWLALHLAPGRSGNGDPVSGSREAAVPIRLDIFAMLSPAPEAVVDVYGDQIGPPSIPAVLASWAAVLIEERRLAGPADAEVATVAAWLLRHLEWAASQEWITEMMREIAHLRRSAHGLVPWEVHVQELVGPCPSCDLRALLRVAGETYIECSNDPELGGCGDLWTVEEYEGRVAELTGA
ncbi:hypothetical protein [Streptosporangium sp. NBC_01756]|uniref:hypothetical protein n=1 Tax=Streptosporangium sp. NBC_01756 TaxID=2975950 RepID=UPI002DD8BDB7|nr:hypothetical protein [Streptosporangium sp. NBC_01756]WSC85639.1 hypothetical protein OIE48_35590 [Streptosporangium sp. NBC_01756]